MGDVVGGLHEPARVVGAERLRAATMQTALSFFLPITAPHPFLDATWP
jgi:hypothetical protein